MATNLNGSRPYEQYILTLVLLLISAFLVFTQAAKRLDLLAYDTAINFTPAPIDQSTVIIAIDEKSLNSIGQWPWRRAIHAQLIDKLSKYNTALISLDILFSERSASHPEDDILLAKAIKNNGNVLLPLHLQPLTYGGTLVEILPIPQLVDAAKGMGHVHVDLDQDGLARGLFLNSGIGDAHWPSLSMAMASEINPMIQYIRMLDSSNSAPYMSVNTQYRLIPFAGPGGTFPSYSYLEVMLDQVPAEAFRDKIVLIGATAAGLGDIIPTPVSRAGTPMSGVELHANAFSSLMTNNAIRPVESIWAYLLTFAFIMIPILLFPRLKPTHVMPSTILLVLTVAFFSYTLILFDKTWFPPINSIIGILLAYPLWSWQRMRQMNGFLNQELERLEREPAIGFRHIGQHPVEELFESLNALLKPKHFVLLKNKKIIQQDEHTVLSYQRLKSKDKWFHDGQTSWITLIQTNENKHKDTFHLGFSWRNTTNLASIQDYLNKLDFISPRTLKKRRSYEKIANRITQVREAIHAMQDMRTFISKGFEEIPNAVLVTDPVGLIVFCNSHAHKWFSPTERPLITTPIYALFETKQNHQLIQNMGKALTCGVKTNDELQLNGKDVLIHCVPFLVDENSDAGLMITLSDITHIRQQQREKNQLIDFLSHDVRSPLVSQLAMLNGLRTGRIEWQDKLIPEIEMHAKRSLNLSDQFLQITRAEQSAEQSFYEFDFLNAIENSIDSLCQQASEKGIEINFTDEEPIWLFGNAELIERAITNLLSNAIKYSPNDTQVNLRTKLDNNHISLTISDQGHGISQEELPYIFKRFHRQRQTEISGEKGAGLGLNFVQVVINKHNGKIDVASKINEGTTFTVTFPSLEANKQPV
jgi:CHASE2 domain-containing sensor protein/signal transduction histidine kinase